MVIGIDRDHEALGFDVAFLAFFVLDPAVYFLFGGPFDQKRPEPFPVADHAADKTAGYELGQVAAPDRLKAVLQRRTVSSMADMVM